MKYLLTFLLGIAIGQSMTSTPPPVDISEPWCYPAEVCSVK